MNNSGRSDYLSVSWLSAAGDVDSYLVTLSHKGRTVNTVTVSKSASECSFNTLIPGRLYTVMITTKSGVYEKQALSQERTGKVGGKCAQDMFSHLHMSWHHYMYIYRSDVARAGAKH